MNMWIERDLGEGIFKTTTKTPRIHPWKYIVKKVYFYLKWCALPTDLIKRRHFLNWKDLRKNVIWLRITSSGFPGNWISQLVRSGDGNYRLFQNPHPGLILVSRTTPYRDSELVITVSASGSLYKQIILPSVAVMCVCGACMYVLLSECLHVCSWTPVSGVFPWSLVTFSGFETGSLNEQDAIWIH